MPGGKLASKLARKLLDESDEGIRAFHGTPHDFDQFDTSKIGTGEGNQVFGHGLYFAQNRSVAKAYRDSLTEGNPEAGPGRIFEVNIKADQDKFLDFFERRNAQPENVQRALDKALGPAEGIDGLRKGEEIMLDLEAKLGAKGAAEALRDAGVPGIRYFDGPTRMGADESPQITSNFVVFDERIVEIVKKFGVAGLAIGFGGSQLGEAAAATPGVVGQDDGDLKSDGTGRDTTDRALTERAEVHAQADALQWLMEGAEDQEGEVPGVPGVAVAQPGQPAAAEAAEPARPGDAPAGQRQSFVQSVLTGVGEIPRQAVAGVRDAVQSTLDFGDWLEEQAGLGGVQITDEKGNFDIEFLSGEELAAKRKEGVGGAKLPEFDKAKTIGGAAVREIARFLGPFGLAAKTMGGLRAATTAGSIAKASAAGAVADFFAFGGHEQRLSDVIEKFPALQNPVTEFLASDKDDSEIEGRLKNAIEGLGIGAAAEGLFRGVRAYRKMRRAAGEEGPVERGARAAEEVRTAEPEQVLREAEELSLLGRGDAAAPLVARSKGAQAVKETETGVPGDVAARSLTEGLTPLTGSEDVFVNFARINEPEDIQRIIQDTASAFGEDITKAQRGVRTNVETTLSADKVDAWKTLLGRRTGEPLNAEQSVAARQLWATAADKLSDVAEIASTTPTPENLFQFRRMLATFHAVQKEVLAARTETARALQSWRIPVGGNVERMRDIGDMLDRAGGSETAAMLARKVAVLARTPDAGAALSNFAEKSVAARTLGSVQEYWINALLSGPKTHLVNMMSNTAIVGVSMLERAAASRLSSVFSDELGVQAGEAAAQFAGLRGGIFDGFRNAGKALRTGQTGFGLNKIDLPRERFISSGTWNVRSESWLGTGIDGIGAVVNVPGRLLQAEDEFFKTIGYRMELHAQAHRQVMQEVASGALPRTDIDQRITEVLENPPESIRLEAAGAAAYQTFTSTPGKLSRGIQRFVGDWPALRFVVPFLNTPGNILKYTFERTPLAPLASNFRNAIAQGGAAADLARTKMALGTASLMLAMDLGMNGWVTGSGPEKTSEKQNWRRQGNRPYSLRLGDNFFAFNRMDPLGYHLGIAGDLAEHALNTESESFTSAEAEEAFAAAVFAVAENITSKSYMQGLTLVLEAVNDPKRFGASYMERFGSSFIPTGVREVATFIDPVQRATHDIVSSIKRKIPGMSEDMPARRDLWGRPISYQSGFGRAYDAVSPIYASGFKPEPIDEAMAKDNWFFGMGGHSFSVNGEIVSFRNRPDIKNRYYELRGGTKPSKMEADWLWDRYGDKTLLETLNEMVTGKGDLSDLWEDAETPEDREDLARVIFRDYGRAAREKIIEEFPWITETAARKKAARNRVPQEAAP